MIKVSGLKQKIATSNIAKNKYVQRITSQMGDKVEFKNKAKTKAKSFLKTLIVIATGIFSAIVSFLNKDKETNTTTPNTDNSTKPNNSNSAPQNTPPTTDGDDSADGLDNDVPEAPSATINVTEEEVETEGTTTENNVAISDDTTDAQAETTIKDSDDTEKTQIVDIAEDSDDTNDLEKSAIAVTTNTVPETKVTETPTEITPAVDIESSSGTQKADSNKKAEKTTATDKTSDVDKEKRQKRINELKKYIDNLDAEEAIGINEYHKDCNCSIVNTGFEADKDGFWVIVSLFDNEILNDKELEQEIIKNLKTRDWMQHFSKYGEPTEENLECMTINSKDLEEEKRLFAKLYERAIKMPEDKKLLEKIFEPWYINYIKLCRQLGITPRECGVAGGAFDHYLQLQERQNPDTYSEYVKNLEYRANYDENAFHNLVNLEVDDDNIPLGVGELLHNMASKFKDELSSLKEVLKLAPKGRNKITNLLILLKDDSISFSEFMKAIKELKQELKEAEEESVHEELDIDTIYQEDNNYDYDYDYDTQYDFA